MTKTASWLPDEQQELALRAGLTEDRAEAQETWRRWKSAVGLERAGSTFELLPLIYRNLTRLRLDDDELALMRGAYRYIWSRNQLLMKTGARAIAQLRAAGIETL